MHKSFFHLCSLFSLVCFTSCSKKVDVLLKANWDNQPLIAQAGEFIGDVNPSLYWSFFEYISNCITDSSTDLDCFNCALKFCTQYMPFGYSQLFEFVQGLQYYAPRVQMYRHIAQEYTQGYNFSNNSCNIFVVLCDTIVVCDITLLDTYLPLNLTTCVSKYLDIGHPSTLLLSNINITSNSAIAVVYGPFGRQITFNYFAKIKSLVKVDLLTGFVYRPWYTSENGHYSSLLSGYGVELAIKDTEYHTMDDPTFEDDYDTDLDQFLFIPTLDGLNFQVLSSLYISYSQELYSLQNRILEIKQQLLPLKKWQISDLGLQLCQWLLNSFPQMGYNALYSLSEFMKFFPVECKQLYLLDITDGLRKEILYNQRIMHTFGVENGQNLFLLNGVIQILDPFTMMPFLINEMSQFSKLESLGMSPIDIYSLMQLDFDLDEMEYAIDTRHDCIFHINDIENDIEYSSWTRNLHELLRPTFPGVIRQIRRNFFNLVMCLDPSELYTYHLLKSADYFFSNNIAVTIGFIFLSSDATDVAKSEIIESFSCFFSFLSNNISQKFAFNWLLDISTFMFSKNRTFSLQELANNFHKYTDNKFIFNFSCSHFLHISFDFFHAKRLEKIPCVLLNGIPLILDRVVFQDIIPVIKEAILYQTHVLQKDIYYSHLLEEMDVRNFIMTKPNVVDRLNSKILSGTWNMIDFCFKDVHLTWFEDISILPFCEVFQIFAKNTPYIVDHISHSRPDFLTLWLVADFSSLDGMQFLMDSLEMLSVTKTVRIGLIFNEFPSLEFGMNKVLMSLIFSQKEEYLFSIIYNFKSYSIFSEMGLENFLRYLSTFENFDNERFLEFAQSDVLNVMVRNYYYLASEILNISRDFRAVVANGRILDTIFHNELFNVMDFLFLESFSFNQYGKKFLHLFNTLNFNTSIANQNLFANYSLPNTFRSDIIIYLSAIILGEHQKHRVTIPFQEFRGQYSLISLPPRLHSNYFFHLDIILDPLSKEAQKILPFSLMLYNTFNVQLQMWLCPLEQISVIPIRRFYTYLLPSKPTFEIDGSLSLKYPHVEFSHLPVSPLLNLVLDVPHVWVVEATQSDFDLDNLPRNSNNIFAVFTLSHILLEGSCFDHSTQKPVPGVQFDLGTDRDSNKFDSLVMQNLGYFQLKFYPGLWKLHLVRKDSIQPYTISEQRGEHSFMIGETVFVICDSFLGVNLKILVRINTKIWDITNNQVDSYDDDLSNTYDSTISTIWNSFSYILHNKQQTHSTMNYIVADEVINIFSIASGHLYERFLRIMIISVLKHTNNPIKIWILKQYLSPHFKEYIPIMAQYFNFTYELVDYKWPKWLRKQEEKQREIWGYKILFLDVLFPMNLNRIIYVDADQIVRSDLLELMHIDLEGAPYAYTPFCDSKKEMDGFRFWKRGYWNNLLGRRKYHISALYVIDLDRFRKLGAGDKLRANYQALSQDPNSLANLDQDLPNSMIDSVPIFSLAQDWLWCETWCSDEDKAKAKTIDMCNNPLTKEPKLIAAKRIAIEWIDYDQEANNFMLVAKRNIELQENTKLNIEHTEL